MSVVVSAHQLSQYTNPQAGQAGTASVVLGNDNTTVVGYNTHDADPTIHVQSSTLAARPAATATPGVQAGSLWFTNDGFRLYYSDGATWTEAQYLPIVGGTVTGVTVITNSLSIAAASTTVFRAGLTLSNPVFAVDSSTALQVAGISVKGAVTGGTVEIVVTDSGLNASITFNALGNGSIGIGTVSTGTITLGSSVTVTSGKTLTLTGVTISAFAITSASATAFAVGPSGTTNPVLQIDASTASQTAGLKLTGAAGGGDVILETITGGSQARFIVRANGSQNLDLRGGGSGGGVLFSGIGSGTGTTAVFDGSNFLLKSSSSLRYKRWIGKMEVGDARAFVLGLNVDGATGRGAGWYYSTSSHDDPKRQWPGFTAERGAEIAPAFIMYNEKGEPDSFLYDRMTVPHNILLGDHERRIAALEVRV